MPLAAARRATIVTSPIAIAAGRAEAILATNTRQGVV